MRKKLLGLVFTSGLAVALGVALFGGAGTASAFVHGVSQASCANSGNSGALNSSVNVPGAHAAQIPVAASAAGSAASGGQSLQPFGGGNLDGAGFECDTPPSP